jgi:hypothetical protein
MTQYVDIMMSKPRMKRGMAFAITFEKSVQGFLMGSEDKGQRLCGICNERPSVTVCDGCLRPLCKKCRVIEIWRSADEEVTIKSFCSECRDNPQVNPHGPGGKVFGLGQVTDMVNQEQQKINKFTIRLKIK